MNNEKYILKNEIQFEADYDVIIVGGGTTGCCAAIASARGGAKTAIVEYNAFLGGNMTSGLPWLGFHSYEEKRMVVKGIPLEIIERLQKIGGASEFLYDPICSSAVGVNGTLLKVVLAEMAEEEKIDVYFHSLAIAARKDGNQVTGVYIQNKQGCQLLKAKVTIDCTDSADVCVLAGAKYEKGRRSDNKVQVASYILRVGQINIDEMVDYFEKNPDQMRPFTISSSVLNEMIRQMRTAPLFILGAFPELIAKAKASGINYGRDRLIGVAYPKQREIILVASRVENVVPNDVRNYSRAELLGIKQSKVIIELLRKYIPGCQNAQILSGGSQIGIRESRHVFGDYYLTGEDLLSGKKFKDVIALGAYHLDIHSPDHEGLESKRPPVYQIPFRSLVVNGMEGLMVAGRGISASHEAMASTRITPISAAQGHAAGTAAALSVKYGVLPRCVDTKKLQAKLILENAQLDL